MILYQRNLDLCGRNYGLTFLISELKLRKIMNLKHLCKDKFFCKTAHFSQHTQNVTAQNYIYSDTAAGAVEIVVLDF